MEQQAQASYSGWSLIELLGHNHEAGFVTTLYFGGVALLQVDVPEIPAREETLTKPQWGDSGLLPVGTIIQKESIPGRTCMINPGSIYRLSPATEEAVRAAISASERRAIKVISMPAPSAERTLLPGEADDDTEDGSDTDDFD
jgi:hypothetical protein